MCVVTRARARIAESLPQADVHPTALYQRVLLKQVTLAQVVNFLHKIESAPQPLSVKSLGGGTRTAQRGA